MSDEVRSTHAARLLAAPQRRTISPTVDRDLWTALDAAITQWQLSTELGSDIAEAWAASNIALAARIMVEDWRDNGER